MARKVIYSKNTNHEYFHSLDNERKVYFLGLLYADGCVKIGKNNRQNSLQLSLQEDDGYIVEELSKDLCSNRKPIVSYPPSTAKYGWKKRVTFTISSNTLCNRLINLGCIPNKSALGIDFDFSQLSEELLRHFIRGFFDGDGCIYVKNVKNAYKRITTKKQSRNFKEKLHKKIVFCSTSLSFLEEILKVLQYYCNLTSKPQWSKKVKRQTTYCLRIEGQQDVVNIKEWMYLNSTIFMKRKLDKFNMTISSQAEDKSSEGSETT